MDLTVSLLEKNGLKVASYTEDLRNNIVGAVPPDVAEVSDLYIEVLNVAVALRRLPLPDRDATFRRRWKKFALSCVGAVVGSFFQNEGSYAVAMLVCYVVESCLLVRSLVGLLCCRGPRAGSPLQLSGGLVSCVHGPVVQHDRVLPIGGSFTNDKPGAPVRLDDA